MPIKTTMPNINDWLIERNLIFAECRNSLKIFELKMFDRIVKKTVKKQYNSTLTQLVNIKNKFWGKLSEHIV